MRSRPALLRLLALLLLLQWGSAFAQCLHVPPAPGAFHVEICTAEGIRLVSLPTEAPEPDQQPDQQASGFCPLCAGPPGLALPAEPVSLLAPLVLAQTTQAPPPPGPGPAPPPSCRPPPRAPPTS